jgi:hypothetical protein
MQALIAQRYALVFHFAYLSYPILIVISLLSP